MYMFSKYMCMYSQVNSLSESLFLGVSVGTTASNIAVLEKMNLDSLY